MMFASEPGKGDEMDFTCSNHWQNLYFFLMELRAYDPYVSVQEDRKGNQSFSFYSGHILLIHLIVSELSKLANE